MTSLQDLILKNPWWQNAAYKITEASWPKRDLFATLQTELSHPLMLNVVGLRRVGKSTLLKQLIAHLLTQNIPAKRLFYFLFDYSHQIQKPEFLDEVVALYLNDVLQTPLASLETPAYIFLDEIQYIDNWQGVLKKYYDLSGKMLKFIVSGSQSVLLRGKQRESLSGRIFDHYLTPLSFAEFIKINKETVEPPLRPWKMEELPGAWFEISRFNLSAKQWLAPLAQEYVTTGQFPETRAFASPAQRHAYILESVLGKVLEDCVRLFKIEKADEFKLVAYHLLQNTASLFELKNIGREIALSQITLERYLKFLKEAFLVEVLYKYHASSIKSGRTLKKLYATAVNFTSALRRLEERHVREAPDAFGKIIENAVYARLASAVPAASPSPLSFWRKGEKEIDFIVSRGQQHLPIEVKFGSTIRREDLAAFNDYNREKRPPFGIVVTRDMLERQNINGVTVYFVPYYLFLFVQ